MRLLLLIALVGIAVARCPFGNKRCFNQLLRDMQGDQSLGYELDYEDDDYNNIDSDEDSDIKDTDDEDETEQQCRCYGGECECDQDQNEEQCERGDIDCYRQQQQKGGQCKPKYQLLRELEKPNCNIAAKLYKQAKQEADDKNTVVSPAALQITLAALQKGAKGSTKTQIKRAQCPRLTQKQCQQAHAALIRSLKGTNNVQKTQYPGQPSDGKQKAKINCATAIIVNQQTSPGRSFVQTVQKCLGGKVTKCSFKQNPQQCRQKINQLVSQKTCNKCKNTVPKQAVTGNTKMIAVSALQVQAKWGQQFRQQQTTKQTLCKPLGSKTKKPCQVIQSRGRFPYYEDGDVKVVGIPTQQQELTVYIMVPKGKDGLTRMEKQKVQNGQQLKEILDNCDQQKKQVKIEIPKFQIKHKLDAKQTLLKQGVQDAFDNDQADFAGITGQPKEYQQEQGQNTHLNKLIHQATIKITEQGITSATAGSQQQIIQNEIEQIVQQQQDQYDEYDQSDYQDQYGQKQVKATHAFAFAIKHNPSNQIILVGRVVDPTQKPKGQSPIDDDDQYDGDDYEN